MNDTARRTMESQAINVRTKHLMRMNMSKLSKEQLRTLERSIKDYRELVEDNRFKNVFSDIYRRYDKESAWEILDLWYHNAQASAPRR